MSVVKNITMRQYNGTDYDTLYPKTVGQQVLLNDSDLAELYGVNSVTGTVHDALWNTGIVQLDNVYSTPPPRHSADELSTTYKAAYMGAAPLLGGCILAGGRNGSNAKNTVIKYDMNGVITSASSGLTTAKSNMASGSLISGNQSRSFFACGTTDGVTGINTIDVYSESLIKLNVSGTAVDSVFDCGSALVGDYFVIAGGRINSSTTSLNVYGYNFALVKQTFTSLSLSRSELAGASIMDSTLGAPSICFFVGGENNGSVTNTVDSYTNTGTHSTLSYSMGFRALSAASSTYSSGYAIFTGGSVNNSSNETAPGVGAIYAYDKNSVLQNIGYKTFQITTYDATGGTSTVYFEPEFVYFAGGVTPGYLPDGTLAYQVRLVTTVDKNLLIGSVVTNSQLQNARAMMAGVCYADANKENVVTLFAGGIDGYDNGITYSNNIDKYTDGYGVEIKIPPFSSYKFDGIHTEEQHTAVGLTYVDIEPVSGYIRLGGLTLSGLLE